MGRFIDLTGQTFGRLRVLRRVEDKVANSGQKEVMYLCLCSCGNECRASRGNLRRGYTKSCGCLQKEVTRERCLKRDDVSRRLYIVYRNMVRRCSDEKDASFGRYGGRGISVCQEWKGDNGCEEFIRWSRENGYDDGLSIDRIDNDGDYCPSNCRWVTAKEQSNNRSTNKKVVVDGIEKTVAQWSEYLGLRSEWLYSYSDAMKKKYIKKKLKKIE